MQKKKCLKNLNLTPRAIYKKSMWPCISKTNVDGNLNNILEDRVQILLEIFSRIHTLGCGDRI